MDTLSLFETKCKNGIDINDDLPVTTVDLGGDKNKETKNSSYIVWDIRDHKKKQRGIMISEMRALLQQYDRKLDSPSTLAEFRAAGLKT